MTPDPQPTPPVPVASAEPKYEHEKTERLLAQLIECLSEMNMMLVSDESSKRPRHTRLKAHNYSITLRSAILGIDQLAAQLRKCDADRMKLVEMLSSPTMNIAAEYILKKTGNQTISNKLRKFHAEGRARLVWKEE